MQRSQGKTKLRGIEGGTESERGGGLETVLPSLVQIHISFSWKISYFVLFGQIHISVCDRQILICQVIFSCRIKQSEAGVTLRIRDEGPSSQRRERKYVGKGARAATGVAVSKY